MAFMTQGGQTALYYVTNSSGEIHKIGLPATPPVTPHISVTNVVTPTSVVAPGDQVQHTVTATALDATAVVATATATATVPITPAVQCKIADVKGLSRRPPQRASSRHIAWRIRPLLP